jgi:RNA polymerase sigma-70 factor (ECF subfamily)
MHGQALVRDSDTELVERLRNGDEATFAGLIFEGRSSVKTWLFKILTNKAKTRALRERRTIPFSQFDSDNADEPAVDPDRFLPASHPQWPGHWATAAQPWSMGPEGTALDRETRAVLRGALEALPRAQRAMVALRDVHGWPAADVCAALDLTQANQRVLLHRGRSRLRAVLERYFADADPITCEQRRTPMRRLGVSRGGR